MTLVNFNRKPLNKSFNNLLDDFFTDVPVFYKNGANWNNKISAPVNIKETDKSYVLDIVAPGFDKADFKINIDQQQLTVSAEKKEETKNETEKAIRNEYVYRSFERSFTLDEKVDTTTVEAKYNNGVLTLNLPKKEEVKAAIKEITIQ